VQVQVPWNEQRQKVFLDRYALKNKKGEPIETKPSEMFRRVANAIGDSKEEQQKFFEIMNEWKFIPAGRILAGAGSGYGVTYFNCFVIPVEAKSPGKGNDSRTAIMDTIATVLEINSRGGGVGINWSTLRPRGTYVKGVGGISSGAVSWMMAADGVAAQVEQGGSRRAALMFMLHDWHPDIEEFIDVKKDLSKLQHANLSVCVSEDFMEAVEEDREWVLEFPDTSHPAYNEEWDGHLRMWKIRGYPTRVYKRIKARKLWDKICEAAWRCGEPGVVFLERYNLLYNARYCSEIIATNPCGELGLEPYGVCNLGALNLVGFLSKDGRFDLEEFDKTVAWAVRFLDNVIDKSSYFLPENEKQAKGLRRLGLGVMGLADTLILMGIRYGSKESLELTETIFEHLAISAYSASVELARERSPFPQFSSGEFLKSPFVRKLPQHLAIAIEEDGIRNATLLAQAPTGTTSILAGVSSGIEPNFAKEYRRKDRTGEHVVRHWLADNPAFVCTHEVSPEQHVAVQAAVQKWVDSSVSKTVNLPNNATKEEVKRIYELAHQKGCKGITVYRDGSREGVLQTVTSEESSKSEEKTLTRPATLKGVTTRIETPSGRAYITLNFANRKPFEVFANIGKAGSDIAAVTEAIARLVSLSLRSGVPVKEITDQLIGIGGASSVGFGQNRICSIPDAIGKVLKNFAEKGDGQGNLPVQVDICPSCGVAAFVLGGGCQTCQNCGYSKC